MVAKEDSAAAKEDSAAAKGDSADSVAEAKAAKNFAQFSPTYRLTR